MDEIRVLAPNGLLGYGFPMASFEAGMALEPHVVAVDGGSTDPGPYYLGAGKSFTDRAAVKRDVGIILPATLKAKIPFIVGTAGGSGAAPHVEWMVDIVKETAKEKGLSFKMAVIQADIDKDYLAEKMAAGKVITFDTREELTQRDIDESTYIVAQMGVEPYIKALENDVDVIIAGRSYDPASMAAVAVMNGFDEGLATHMCKILECGSIAATPGSAADCLMGIIRKDHFIMKPLNPERRCTTTSVAAHTLYEKANPLYLPGPGGAVDLANVKFEQFDESSVKVSHSKFERPEKYTIKLEGAAPVGYRTICICGARCPAMLEHIDEIIEGSKERVLDVADAPKEDYEIIFHMYGRDGVMGALEPQADITSQELGIVIEVVAKTQDMANTICSLTRSTMLHYGFEGRVATAGNLALLYSPSDMPVGAVYRFSIYHLLEVDDACETFPITYWDVEG